MSSLTATKTKTLSDPLEVYNKSLLNWKKSRAACSGEQAVKNLDNILDPINFSNLLIPFSPSMRPDQYSFYKSEAEWPGIVAQYAKMLVGGLLRKKPTLALPEDAPEEAQNWIMNTFSQDSSSLSSFLDSALWEEMQTSRAWIQVDYPRIDNPEELTKEELLALAPYPILHSAEAIINWKVDLDSNGKQQLTRIVIKGEEERYDDDKYEFHPEIVPVIWVHELLNGAYQIRKFVEEGKGAYKLEDTIDKILFHNEPLDIVPFWPINGSIEIVEPMLLPLVTKEIALYNKLSRRNHLLYGASTYTPVISSDMSDDEFDAIVDSGLGTWLRLRQGDTASVLETPTAALQDMDRAIANHIDEMSKMGIKMLSPEAAQSGVALEIRNAAQTAQLGTLNMKVSSQLSDIICFMLNWRYDLGYSSEDIEFSLSSDFNPVPLGADWLRLATEWYQQGFIPRSVWLMILKINDMLPPDYNDEEGKQEINADEQVNFQKQQNMQYAQGVLEQQLSTQ